MNYPNIDIQKTGNRIQQLLKESGYTVKQVQAYLHLACPQPIYRWIQGKILPSLNHLYALSVLLDVHMEDLLVPIGEDYVVDMWKKVKKQEKMRHLIYYRKLQKAS